MSVKYDLNRTIDEVSTIYDEDSLLRGYKDADEIIAMVQEYKAALDKQMITVGIHTHFKNVLVIGRESSKILSSDTTNYNFEFSIRRIPTQYMEKHDHDIYNGNLNLPDGRKIVTKYVESRRYYHRQDSMEIDPKENAAAMFKDIMQILDRGMTVDRIVLWGDIRYLPEKYRMLDTAEQREDYYKVRYEKELRQVYDKCKLPFDIRHK